MKSYGCGFCVSSYPARICRGWSCSKVVVAGLGHALILAHPLLLTSRSWFSCRAIVYGVSSLSSSSLLPCLACSRWWCWLQAWCLRKFSRVICCSWLKPSQSYTIGTPRPDVNAYDGCSVWFVSVMYAQNHVFSSVMHQYDVRLPYPAIVYRQ